MIQAKLMANSEKLIEDIKSGVVKGSTGLAKGAAMALLKDAEAFSRGPDNLSLSFCVIKWGIQIKNARPSQVTLVNGVNRALDRIDTINEEDDRKVLETLRMNVNMFVNAVEMSKNMIAEIGANMIPDNAVILTSSYSEMVMAIVKKKVERDKKVTMVVSETRPYFKGTQMAKELAEMGVETHLIIDSAVRPMIKALGVDLVLVGADTVCSDGTVITKIGTSQIAIAADASDIPLYVAAPTFKFSKETLGELTVHIEEKSKEDIVKGTSLDGKSVIPNLTIHNPSYDTTSPEYIRGIITEQYIMSPHLVGEYLFRQNNK